MSVPGHLGLPTPADTDERGRSGDVLIIAASAALLAAFAFVARWGYVWFIRREVVGVSRDIAWMAPSATLLIWGAAAVPAALVATRLPRLWTLRLAGFGFFSLTTLSILLPVGQLARWAIGILSLGVGVAIARALAERPDRLRILRQVAAGVGVALGASAVAIAASNSAPPLLRSASESPANAPSVLLIVVDALRADALGVYGAPGNTSPHLDSLAAQGARFTHAIATAPWTRPSHRSLFTGLFPIRDHDDAHSWFLVRQDQDTAPLLAEWFRGAGYATGAFVANLFYTGWDAGFLRGFDTYRDYPRTLEQVLRTSALGQTAMARSIYAASTWSEVVTAIAESDFTVPVRPRNASKTATQLVDEFLAWPATSAARPFFAFLNFFDTHAPYTPPAPFSQRFGNGASNRDRYHGATAYVDEEVARLLKGLRDRGVLDNTIVVITSDHGELFGEHGLAEHTSNLYLKVLHVPLVVWWPSHVPGAVVETEVSLRDVPRTIAELALPSRTSPFPGASLAPLWRGESALVSPALSLVERGVRSDSTLPFTKGAMESLLDREWHYIFNSGTRVEELFRYRLDPYELHDLAPDPAADSVRRRLRVQLDETLRRGASGPVSSAIARDSSPSLRP